MQTLLSELAVVSEVIGLISGVALIITLGAAGLAYLARRARMN